MSHATTTDPATATAFNRRGMSRFVQGDLSGALADFRTAAQCRSDCPEPWNNCGIVRQRLGDLAGALGDFDQALALQPDYAEARNNRARARQAMGDHQGALADFDRALDCATGRFRASVLHNRGAMRQHLGDVSGALADFDRALEIDPDHVATHVNRGEARKEAGDLDGALADFDCALVRTPAAAAAPIYHARGGVRALRNDFAGAIAEYDDALRIEPGYYLAYISRGHARYHRRDPHGLADYLTAFALNPEGTARELLRFLTEGVRRDSHEVLDNCDRHLRLDGEDLLAHARRGVTLVLLGRDGEAAPHLARLRARVPAVAPLLDRILELAGKVDPTSVLDRVLSDLAAGAGESQAQAFRLGRVPGSNPDRMNGAARKFFAFLKRSADAPPPSDPTARSVETHSKVVKGLLDFAR
jgi:tetratricopeptide (TPR) repeat protein